MTHIYISGGGAVLLGLIIFKAGKNKGKKRNQAISHVQAILNNK